MSSAWTWSRPTSVAEAVEALEKGAGLTVAVAGGTSVCLSPPRKDEVTMVDLADAGLDTIVQDGASLRIGAMVTARKLALDETVRAFASGLLSDAAAHVGPRPVRNRITVGGNVMGAYTWSDLPVVLLALDAEMVIAGPGGTRSLSVSELFKAHPKRALEKGELLEAVVLDGAMYNRAGCFERLSRVEVDHAIASSAVVLELGEDEKVTTARVVVGALGPLPQRLEEVEAAIVGTELSQDDAERACRAAAPRIHRDRRVSEAYRREVTQVLVRRALINARQRAAKTRGGGQS